MKQKWVTLKRGWHLRSSQDGLELVGPEHNISLEFANPGTHRKRVASILRGLQAIPQGPDNEGVAETIKSLSTQGIVQYQKEKPQGLYVASKTEQILWKLRSAFVGSRGPISVVYRLNFTGPKFPESKSHLFAAIYTSYEGTEKEWAGGTDEDSSTAELKVVMEALERWANGIIPEEELLKCSSRKLGAGAVNPQRVIAYARWQYQQKGFQLRPFSATQEYFWKEVKMFPEKKSYYLPVECIYYPVAKRFAPTPYTFANSSGTAAAFSFEEALTGGIYEAVERDAFMLTWLNRLKQPRIKNSTLPEREQRRMRGFERLGYAIYLIDITLDLAPVILAIAVSHTRKPALILGAASRFNLLEAISRALGEVENQFYWELSHADRIHTIESPEEVKSVLDHMALYASQKYLAKAEFLWQGAEIAYREAPFTDEKQELEKLIRLLEASGRTLVTADLTPHSLKELGIWVVKSIPLGLVPISFGYGMEPLGVPRIHEIPGGIKDWQGKPFVHPFA